MAPWSWSPRIRPVLHCPGHPLTSAIGVRQNGHGRPLDNPVLDGITPLVAVEIVAKLRPVVPQLQGGVARLREQNLSSRTSTSTQGRAWKADRVDVERVDLAGSSDLTSASSPSGLSSTLLSDALILPSVSGRGCGPHLPVGGVAVPQPVVDDRGDSPAGPVRVGVR
jgi:hypothetical protein